MVLDRSKSPNDRTDMKSIGIIGGGIAGIATTKELCERGFKVDCYEMMPRVGGVFASHVWKNGQMTSSTIFTWFSDYPIENRQHFLGWEELLVYLENYIDHNDIRKSIHLNTKVIEAREDQGRWILKVKRDKWTNGHPFHPKDQSIDVCEVEVEHDHLVICNGLHQKGCIPSIPGLENFAGTILHSSDYRDAESVRNKNVVIVGSGESASDIALQVSEKAKQCVISMRSAPGTLFPHRIQGHTADIRDDRLSYNIPRVLKNVILSGHRKFYNSQQEERELFKWAGTSNYYNERCHLNSNACKSFGIPRSIIEYGARTTKEIKKISSSKIDFKDGESFEADTIIFCTGFEREFTFLEKSLQDKLKSPNKLWKNIILPELGMRLFMVGFARPHQINLLSIAELQSRFIGALLEGKIVLDRQKMDNSIKKDNEWMHKYYGHRYSKNPALVDYMYYTEGLADLMGCKVPIKRALLRDPVLWFKLIFAAMNGAHFRLVGHGSNWAEASRTIKATPLFKIKYETLQRWLGLTVLTLFSAAKGLHKEEWKLISEQAKHKTPKVSLNTLPHYVDQQNSS